MAAKRVRDGRGGKAARRKSQRLRRKTKAQGLRCAWCGQPIDTTLPDTDPMSFTADHPEAIGAGGHLVKQEFQPMHRRCNAIKGTGEETEIWFAT